jgi:hypothetical protein
MQIAEINWGDDSAERDQNLLNYFVAPFDYARLGRLEKPIVVGRKGAGKSALRKKLSADLSATQDFVVVECVPDYKVLTSINSDKDVQENFDSEIFFQYVWLTHLYSKAFSIIGEMAEGKFASKSYAAARQFALDKGIGNADFFENFTNIVSGIKAKAGSLGELGMSVDKTLKTVSGVEALEFHIKALALDGVKFVFLVDDLDLGWNNSSISNKSVLGLLLACDRIRAEYRDSHYACVFLRDDMYRLVLGQTMHSDKFRNILNLRWEQESLISVLEERIKFAFESSNDDLPEKLFLAVFPDFVGVSEASKWMVERTLRRPRELIQLARTYTEKLKDNNPSSDALKAAEENYSKWKLDDLCSEFRNQYPDAKLIFDYWRANFDREKYHLDWDDFSEKLFEILDKVKIQHVWFKQFQADADLIPLASMLFEIGFIGDYIVGGDGGSKVIYSDEDHQPKFEQIQIHPCFRRAAGTVQRIRTRAS